MRCSPGWEPHPQDAAVQILLRCPRLGLVRRDLRGSGVLPDPHRDRDPRGICRGDRPAYRRQLPAHRIGQRFQPQGAHPLGRAGGAGGLCAGRYFARAPARGRRPARRRFPDAAGRRGVRRLYAAVSVAAAARPDGQAGRVFPGIDDRQFRAGSGRAFSRSLRRIIGAPGRDADRGRPQEGPGDPRRGLQRPGRDQRRLQPQPLGAGQSRARRRYRRSAGSSMWPSTTRRKAGWSSI